MAEARPRTEPEQVHFLRYCQPRRWPTLARYPVPEALLDDLMAEVLGCTPENVRRMVKAFERTTAQHAADLLAEPGYHAGIDDLPFGTGDVVVALGDSLTADRLGWFEVLAASLRAAGGGNVVTHNLAVSGNTSADAIEQWDLIVDTRPTHVLAMLGTNDARGHGLRERYRMVTRAETVRNLRALEALVTGQLHAQFTLITPPPAVDPRTTGSVTDLSAVGWRVADIDETAEDIRRLGVDHIDLHAGLVDQVRAGRLVQDDGLHLNVDGQLATARVVVSALRRAAAAATDRPSTGGTQAKRADE